MALHFRYMHGSNVYLSFFLSLYLLFLQGKRLPAYLSADAEEGEVSDDDSADEIEEDFKLKSSNVRLVNVALNWWQMINCPWRKNIKDFGKVVKDSKTVFFYLNQLKQLKHYLWRGHDTWTASTHVVKKINKNPATNKSNNADRRTLGCHR